MISCLVISILFTFDFLVDLSFFVAACSHSSLSFYFSCFLINRTFLFVLASKVQKCRFSSAVNNLNYLEKNKSEVDTSLSKEQLCVNWDSDQTEATFTVMGSRAVRRFCDACVRAAQCLPVIFILAVACWSYYAYLVQLCYKTVLDQDGPFVTVLLGILYHIFLVLFLW